jgi:glycosyltransferase 2 family protein
MACLHPKIIKFGLDLVLRVLRKAPIEESVSSAGMARALAWSVGFLIIFFPGGIGPREIALIAVLAPVMSSASALVVALASRVVMTIGDLFWAGIGLAFGRARPKTAPQDSEPRDPAPSGSISTLTEPAGNQPSTARDRRP